MKIATLSIKLLLLFAILLGACKPTQTMQKELMPTQYLVSMVEGYSDVDLRALLGKSTGKILPASKSKNLYMVNLEGENIESLVNELKQNPMVTNVVAAVSEPKKPENMTSPQMKKSTPILNNEE